MRKRNAAGTLTPATALSFAVGDFVEVEATVDFILRRAKNGSDSALKTVETRLKPIRITKLLASGTPLITAAWMCKVFALPAVLRKLNYSLVMRLSVTHLYIVPFFISLSVTVLLKATTMN